MSQKIHIFNATIVNEDTIVIGEIFIEPPYITKINIGLKTPTPECFLPIDAEGLYLLPGVIDDQVHFREPGLTHKADIFSESSAAVAGGVTSFFDNPNTVPPTLSLDLLEDKYRIASQKSRANYSFFMGASNDNIDEVLRTPLLDVCGIKMFLGASTGNLLVDNQQSIEKLFGESAHIIATHCEDETTIRRNVECYKNLYGSNAPASIHPLVRSAEACFLSSSATVALARKLNTNLHVYHLSTAIETDLFEQPIPLEEKKITAEVCVHHLWFSDVDYEQKGNFIKWNPAIKTVIDRNALRQALKDGKIDIVATDHAPHTREEKLKPYFEAPSGGPLVQHSLPAMLTLANDGVFSLNEVVKFMSHNPAFRFKVDRRGFIREGYYADLVLVDLSQTFEVSAKNVIYKCAWSPFEGSTLKGSVHSTFVNGYRVYFEHRFNEFRPGMRIMFNR